MICLETNRSVNGLRKRHTQRAIKLRKHRQSKRNHNLTSRHDVTSHKWNRFKWKIYQMKKQLRYVGIEVTAADVVSNKLHEHVIRQLRQRQHALLTSHDTTRSSAARRLLMRTEPLDSSAFRLPVRTFINKQSHCCHSLTRDGWWRTSRP